jgi:hypothetical protein
LAIGVSLGNIQRNKAAGVVHQILRLPSAPNSVQPNLSLMAVNRTQAPQSVL